MTQNPSDRPASGALMPALLLFGGITLILVAAFAMRPSQHQYTTAELTATASANQAATATAGEAVALAATATVEAAQPTAVQEVALALDPAQVASGESAFQSICAACHGFNAQGITGLGKPLVDSDFVDSLSDEELVAFIIEGRDITDPLNTTGVPMPARGGNPSLSDDAIHDIVVYIRSLNQPAADVAVEPTPVPTQSGPTPTPIEFVPLPLTAADDAPEVEPTAAPSLFASGGEEWYVRSCSGCHGLDGNGVPYIPSSSLADSALIQDRDGIGLLNFLTDAQPPVSPEVAYPHPYRGGYPELTDAQIREIIAYLYTLPLE